MNINSSLRRIALWCLDLLVVGVSYKIALTLKFNMVMSIAEQRVNNYLILILIILVTVLNFLLRHNKGFMKRNVGQEFGIVLSYNFFVLIGIALFTIALHLTPMPSRQMLLYFFLVNTALMTALRTISKAIARKLFTPERAGLSILIITEPNLKQRIKKNFIVGSRYHICGWMVVEGNTLSGTVFDNCIKCKISELPEHVNGWNISEVFICANSTPAITMGSLVDIAERLGASCHIAINLVGPDMQNATVDRFGGCPTITYQGRGSVFYRRGIKRLIDIVVSLGVIVVAFIPGLILALIIAFQSKGSPFYSQMRLGQGGRHFRLWKFRSMVIDANNVEKYFTPDQLEEWRTERKVKNDPRVTSIGHFLRKTSLDEFPQFLNVLKGEMSIVGPRPIVDDEIGNYGLDAKEFLSCRPGLTGWWQVEARNEADYASGRRQALELYYVRHASFELDWKIFTRTFGAVFHGTGKLSFLVLN